VSRPPKSSPFHNWRDSVNNWPDSVNNWPDSVDKHDQ
jgi:hypothetical protein